MKLSSSSRNPSFLAQPTPPGRAEGQSPPLPKLFPARGGAAPPCAYVDPPLAMTVCNAEEPILCRMDRLDNMLRQLEEIRGCNNNNTRASHSPKSSSFASTPSRTSDGVGHVSSSAELISPESLEKHCRPMEHVMMETDVKGTLIERLDHVEDRVLKLCMQLEEELTESDKKKRNEEEIMKRSEREEKIIIDEIEKTQVHVIKKKKKKKGLKQLVKQCVMGKR